MKRKVIYSSILLATAAMGMGVTTPTIAQERSFQLEEIVVTARRREERLQDVPVSMTVLNQDAMHNANIINASDIATYTPSLMANNRFGADSTNFAIRGFSQELRTTSSVGVYFAEVIAPRGANTTQSADGAGPGDFFDLESVQVLKGPQGTLFGRNTTGGAVLLTPKKPTDEFEGYVEGSIGNYDMKRVQAVVNVPVADSFRMRFGVDHQKRDGYLNNISDVGPSDFANMDYTSLRASFVWDITDNLENYTIVKYTESDNHGEPYALLGCNTSEPNPRSGAMPSYGAFCQGDLNRRIASGNNGEYDIYNFHPDPSNEIEQWQVINTTTWEISDNLTIKNIISYAEFENTMNAALYGTDWRLSDLNPMASDQHILFQMVGAENAPTTDQKSFVEEFQLQGTAFEERLTWQAGLYYEKSKPNGTYGSQNPSTISCDMSTVMSPNARNWECNNLVAVMLASQGNFAALPFIQLPALGPFNPMNPGDMQAPFPGAGSVLIAPGGVEYENKAIYLQGTYEFTDRWSMTAGLRYTWDDTEGWTDETVLYYPGDGSGGYSLPTAETFEQRRPKASSEEPTWLIGVEYKPMDDVMLYAKYARGYRQGSVNLASEPEWQTHGPEQVDTYEIGAKTSFYGRFPGTFNVSLFYNDFEDQQVQFGYLRGNGVGSTSILNAGTSTIWGAEVDGNVLLTDNLSLNFSYAYLNTEVDELVEPTPAEWMPTGVIWSGTSTAVGEPLSYAPEHQLVLSGSYRFPISETVGEMIATVSYIYTDDMQAVSKETTPFYKLPSYELVNANFNWNNIMGSPVDVSIFATNLTNERYLTNVTGNYYSGLEAGRRGVPRMYGARVRYNF